MCKYCDNLTFWYEDESNSEPIYLSDEFKQYSGNWSGVYMYRFGLNLKELEEKHKKHPTIYTEEFINKHKSHPLYGKIVLHYWGDDGGYIPINYCPFCGKKLI